MINERLDNNMIMLCQGASVTLLALPGCGDACLTQGQEDDGQVSVPLCRDPAAASGKENSVSLQSLGLSVRHKHQPAPKGTKIPLPSPWGK